MSGITPNQFTVLEALQDGPGWMRSFQTVKPLVHDLISRGLIEPCRPHLGRARNMVRLTPAGCDLLEIDARSIPVQRAKPSVPQAPSMELHPIKGDATPEIRSTCEAFIRAINAGTTVREAIAELAAAHDVQRPAIWRRLRSGGVLPPYTPKQPGGNGRPVGGGVSGYTQRRRDRSLAVSEARQPVPSESQHVSRDPCPRCGVRGDRGCRHSRAPLGMSF